MLSAGQMTRAPVPPTGSGDLCEKDLHPLLQSQAPSGLRALTKGRTGRWDADELQALG